MRLPPMRSPEEMTIMRKALLAVLLGASAFATSPLFAQNTDSTAQPGAQQPGGAADLCKELLAYADRKAKEPPKAQQSQAPGPANAPPPRKDGNQTGTQGGGSVSSSSSNDTSSQGGSAPTTAPTSSGAAPEAASSPHATDGSQGGQNATPEGAPVPDEEFKLAGGVTVGKVREVAGAGERQACRDLAQTVRRAGGDLPAPLIALAAYEPDPAKRKER
jgi:hypothetical protein